jgi:hypothetical protein
LLAANHIGGCGRGLLAMAGQRYDLAGRADTAWLAPFFGITDKRKAPTCAGTTPICRSHASVPFDKFGL